jgi:hypothetical protein
VTVDGSPSSAPRQGRASDASEESFLLATEALAGFLYDFDVTTGWAMGWN